MLTLLIATRNAHKAAEIRAILGEGIRCLTLDDFPGAPEVVEDAGTFAGNATKKAVRLANWLGGAQRLKPGGAGINHGEQAGGLYVLADDSGLEVDALNGAPGFIRRDLPRWTRASRAIRLLRRTMPSCCAS